MVDSLPAFIRRLTWKCMFFWEHVQSVFGLHSLFRMQGHEGLQEHHGIHLDILLCFQDVQELLDRGRQYEFCSYFQVLGSQKRSLLGSALGSRWERQQQPGWWTHLPQHLCKAQRLGGPLPGFVEELFECSADLYDRPPARGEVQLVHVGPPEFKHRHASNRHAADFKSQQQIAPVNFINGNKQLPGLWPQYWELDPPGLAERTWIFHIYREHQIPLKSWYI